MPYDVPNEAPNREMLGTGKISFTKEELAGTAHKTLFHPLNAKAIKAAKKKSKGVNNVQLSGGEIMADLDWHRSGGSGIQGGSVWSWIKDKALPWLKTNVWPVVKPIVSGLVDQGATMLGSYTGQPGLVQAVRGQVRNVTGVGLTTQQKRLSSLEKARAARKSNKVNVMKAGSFLIN